MSKVIELKNVRLSYPSIFEHGTFGGESTGKYSANLLLPKTDTKAYEALLEMVDEIKKTSKLKTDKIFIADGDADDAEETDGHWIIKVANKNRPTLVNRNGTVVTKEDAEANNLLFAGCYVNAFVGAWGMNNAYGKRVVGQLAGLQHVKGSPEDAFGETGTVSAGMFTVLDDEEDTDF